MTRGLLIALLAIGLGAGEADPRVVRLVGTYATESARIEEVRAAAVQRADEARTAGLVKTRTTAISALRRLISSRSDFALQAEVNKAVLGIDVQDADARRFFSAIGTLDQVLTEVAAAAAAAEPTDMLGDPLPRAVGAPADGRSGYVERLPDAAFSASSTFGPSHEPYMAKFSLTTSFANWSAQVIDTNQWLQIDLGRPLPIGSVATMGRASNSQRVTSYRLQGSLDGATWGGIPNPAGGDEFAGNTDQTTAVAHRLPPSLRARYLRFLPLTWSSYISMRVEIYPP